MNMFRAFMELDAIAETASLKLSEGLSRRELINKLETLGKHYNFDKYSDPQLYRMLERAEAEAEKIKQEKIKQAIANDEVDFVLNFVTCDNCGTRLTDGGACPYCDLGDQDFIESFNGPEVYEVVNVKHTLKKLTDNWTSDFGLIKSDDESGTQDAIMVLRQHYEDVEMLMAKEGYWYIYYGKSKNI